MSLQIKNSLLTAEEKKSVISLSVSRIKVFENCLKQFRFQYIEKLPKKEWDFHIFGKFLHTVLEFFYNNWNSGKPWNLTLKEGFIKANEQYKGKLETHHLNELKEILTKYLFFLAKRRDSNFLPKEICGIEREFNLIIDDKILVNGFIDLEQIDYDGVFHVIDYKTTQKKKYLKDRFQLETYALVSFLRYPELKKIRTSFLLFRHDMDSLTEEYTREQIMPLEEKFINYANNIQKEKLFRAKPNNLCRFCSYLDPKLCQEGWNFVNGGDLW